MLFHNIASGTVDFSNWYIYSDWLSMESEIHGGSQKSV